LAELDDDGRIDRLRAEHDSIAQQLAVHGESLSQLRAAAAQRFEQAVTEELTGLAMPRARVSVSISRRPDEHGLRLPDGSRVSFGPHGLDEVELMLAAHTGTSMRPLHKAASGGELSRIMLAIEVVLAGSDPVPTMIFDEIDAGVGGRAAVEIGKRLARLARDRQVLVVTHLPQVAAFADQHLVVDKDDAGEQARTVVREVDGSERIEELTRMLSGLPDSEVGRGHAEELLASAVASKASV
jgi:DNA repair protein RecN (Recombination protein N)